MEDRYLFKAKILDNGEWVQGCYIRDIDRDNSECLSKFSHKIQPLYAQAYMFPVNPNTLCQCTGLKDKNGNLIWEKDIIKTRVGIAKVVWDKSGWQIEWIKDNIWRKDLFYWAIEDIQRVEVIANTFDNPELLESEE